MKPAIVKTSGKKFITDSKGNVEFIVLPVNEYNHVMDLIEDYGLGLAMRETEGEKKCKFI